MGGEAVARRRAVGRGDGDRTSDRRVSGRQDRQMVDARRCRLRRGAELRCNRQDPEDGVTPPLCRALFAREVDGVKTADQAACLPAFVLAGLPAAILAKGSRAPGPGWVWTS